LSGKFIRFQFSDNTGSIELVAFNSFADHSIFKQFQLQSIYAIAYVDVKEMNLSCQKWPAQNGSNYELQVTKETEITPCLDECSSYYQIQKEIIPEMVDLYTFI